MSGKQELAFLRIDPVTMRCLSTVIIVTSEELSLNTELGYVSVQSIKVGFLDSRHRLLSADISATFPRWPGSRSSTEARKGWAHFSFSFNFVFFSSASVAEHGGFPSSRGLTPVSSVRGKAFIPVEFLQPQRNASYSFVPCHLRVALERTHSVALLCACLTTVVSSRVGWTTVEPEKKSYSAYYFFLLFLFFLLLLRGGFMWQLAWNSLLHSLGWSSAPNPPALPPKCWDCRLIPLCLVCFFYISKMTLSSLNRKKKKQKHGYHMTPGYTNKIPIEVDPFYLLVYVVICCYC